jgi:hypothetical protein
MVMMTQAAVELVTGPAGSAAAVGVGLASAGGFAVCNALQHRAAGTVPSTVHRALAVLAHLARQPAWLAATGISSCALLLHAFALQIGSIALVQPLMLVGVVLAVPARAALDHKRPRRCEVRAVGVTVVGLGAFIVFVLSCFALALGALRASRRCRPGVASFQASLLGAGAGVMFGATAGLLKLVGASSTWHGGRLTPLVVLGLLVAAGLLGTAMNQRAYQIAPLAFSMPLVNVVDILVAVLFGTAVFGELPGHTVLALAVQLGALGCIGAGLVLIAALRAEAVTVEPAPTLAAVQS